MKLGFIAMSGLRVQNEKLAELGLTLPGFVERKNVIASLPSLGLLTLAALTPDDVRASYIELDAFSDGDDLPGHFDVVAISSYSAQINSAYKLAAKYKQAGTKVVLGGLHVSSMPDEAIKYADAIVIGEGEISWKAVLSDLQKGKLKNVYAGGDVEYDFAHAPLPRYEMLDIEKYNRLTVQTQRGCPYQCEFCASSVLLTRKYKVKPIEQVVAEINEIKRYWDKPFIELADDNTFASRSHAKRLVTALAGLNVKWFTETDIAVAEDDELLAMLSDSGCRQLLIGFESANKRGLHNIEIKANWKERQQHKYMEAIEKIQRHGISVNGCFILGLDGHDTDVFEDTLNFVKESGLAEVQITLQTPFPNTPLYNRLKNEGRLIDEVFWDKCTLFDVTYHPKQMTVEELEDGFLWLMENIYGGELVKQRKEKFIAQARECKVRGTLPV